jgi:hypothetical protein
LRRDIGQFEVVTHGFVVYENIYEIRNKWRFMQDSRHVCVRPVAAIAFLERGTRERADMRIPLLFLPAIVPEPDTVELAALLL